MTIIHDIQLNAGPEGAAVTVANSGFTGTSPSVVYKASAAHTGPFGAFAPSISDGVGTVTLDTALPGVSIGEAVAFDATPTSDLHVLRIGTGTTRSVSVHINAAGKFRLSNAAGTTGIWTSTTVVSPGVWYVLRLRAKKGTATTNGEIHFEIYRGYETTPLETGYSSTTQDTGTVNFDKLTFGKNSSAAFAMSFDGCMVSDDPDSFIPLAANTLPTPVLTVTKTDPTAPAATDGQAAATWTGAGTFESCILHGSVTTGAVSTRSSTATNRTFTGLSAGTYTVAVRRTV